MTLKPCKECGKEASTEARTCPHCGANLGGVLATTSFTKLGCLGILVVILIGYLVQPAAKPKPPTPRPAENALKQVTLKSRWSDHQPSANVLTIDFEITNNGAAAVKDFTIHCIHHGRSGTAMDENTRTLYEIVEPHSTERFPNIDMGLVNSQIVDSDCSIVKLALR